jgi:hypothetical protein
MPGQLRVEKCAILRAAGVKSGHHSSAKPRLPGPFNPGAGQGLPQSHPQRTVLGLRHRQDSRHQPLLNRLATQPNQSLASSGQQRSDSPEVLALSCGAGAVSHGCRARLPRPGRDPAAQAQLPAPIRPHPPHPPPTQPQSSGLPPGSQPSPPSSPPAGLQLATPAPSRHLLPHNGASALARLA